MAAWPNLRRRTRGWRFPWPSKTAWNGSNADVRRTKDGHHVLFDGGNLAAFWRANRGPRAVARRTQETRSGRRGCQAVSGTRVWPLTECLAAGQGQDQRLLDCQDVDARQLVDEIRCGRHRRRRCSSAAQSNCSAQVRELSGGTIATLARRQTGRELRARRRTSFPRSSISTSTR